ncbi:MAG: DUF4330 family protein [Clostridia bacterium]|nr:DUF4330 family protein [Clostridia bacterium]
MTGRKVKFNAIDAVILIILAAVVGVLLYIFVFSAKETTTPDVTTRTIQYVIEAQNLDDHFDQLIENGQPVQDAVGRKSIGKVVGVQAVPFEKITFNYETGKETVSAAEGRISLRITIEAEVTETDRAFTVDGCEIRVGQQYSLILPEMYAVGYCTDLIVK